MAILTWEDIHDGDEECFVDGCTGYWIVIFEDGVRFCRKHKRDDVYGGYYRSDVSEIPERA